jgi:Ran GTPase-activating protein (RanGAP) involved in mRNA processing and transport
MFLLFHVKGNDLQDYGASKICEMLQKNTNLKHLYLSNNKFEERAAIHFREALSHNECLETLDISWNHFRTNGAVAIAEGVQVWQAVCTINPKTIAIDQFSGTLI